MMLGRENKITNPDLLEVLRTRRHGAAPDILFEG
jgi:hypothetical protein